MLSGNEKADVLAKRAIQLTPANHNTLPLQDYVPLFTVPSVPPGNLVGTSVMWMAINWLNLYLPLVHGLLVPNGVAISPFGSFLVPSPYRSYSPYTRSFDGS